jgi:hypothetical protein
MTGEERGIWSLFNGDRWASVLSESCVDWNWTTYGVALSVVDAKVAQQIEALYTLNALGDGTHSKRLGEIDHSSNHVLTRGLLTDISDELAVNLEVGDG